MSDVLGATTRAHASRAARATHTSSGDVTAVATSHAPSRFRKRAVTTPSARSVRGCGRVTAWSQAGAHSAAMRATERPWTPATA